MSGNPVRDANGILYPSQKACAEALGVSRKAIGYHLNRYGNLERLEGVVGKPVVDRNGVTHESMTICAEAHGVTPSTVSYHLNRWGNLDRLCVARGYTHAIAVTSKPVEVNGRKFSSQAELARAIGARRTTVRNWLRPDASPRQRTRLRHRVAMLGVEQ